MFHFRGVMKSFTQRFIYIFIQMMAGGWQFCFLRNFREQFGHIRDFNEPYWDKLLDKMVVTEEKKLTAIFVVGYSVKIYI